jgi:hypothetical protein
MEHLLSMYYGVLTLVHPLLKGKEWGGGIPIYTLYMHGVVYAHHTYVVYRVSHTLSNAPLHTMRHHYEDS